MIYIVSGYMRTGTSMMMRALQAGGMDIAYSEEREQELQKTRDKFYSPNEQFLEIDPSEYDQLNFPLQYHGKVIKMMQWWLCRLRVAEYKIILMKRDPEEIRQSYEAFSGSYPPSDFMKEYENRTQVIWEQLLNRKDTQPFILNYSWVVNHPVMSFGMLKQWGWPIDVKKASEVIDPSLYRFHKESLVEGLSC